MDGLVAADSAYALAHDRSDHSWETAKVAIPVSAMMADVGSRRVKVGLEAYGLLADLVEATRRARRCEEVERSMMCVGKMMTGK